MERSKTMRAPLSVVLLAFAGCAGSTGNMMDNAGSGGSGSFANASAGTGAPAIQNGTGNPSTGAGSGGRSGMMSSSAGSGGSAAPATGVHGGSGGSAASGSGGTAASSGAGGTPSTGGNAGTPGGSAGMGGADDPLGLADAGLIDPVDPNAPPPAAGQCADAVCFDVFDCTLWHTDLAGVCNFTDCVDFVCQ